MSFYSRSIHMAGILVHRGHILIQYLYSSMTFGYLLQLWLQVPEFWGIHLWDFFLPQPQYKRTRSEAFLKSQQQYLFSESVSGSSNNLQKTLWKVFKVTFSQRWFQVKIFLLRAESFPKWKNGTKMTLLTLQKVLCSPRFRILRLLMIHGMLLIMGVYFIARLVRKSCQWECFC